MKNPSDPTGNQTRELPTAPPREYSRTTCKANYCTRVPLLLSYWPWRSMIAKSIVLLIWNFLCAIGGPEVKRISQQTVQFKNNTATL